MNSSLQNSSHNSISISMKGITKRYGNTLALNGVNFECKAGEIHALLGENGAGKSTLMHILSGLSRQDAGEITVNGAVVNLKSPKEARKCSIAMVHQHFTLVPAFTVAENLALDLPFKGRFSLYSTRNKASTALTKASELGWDLDPDAVTSSLPVGIQQRVEIVKALSSNSQILIFDEPTAVLSVDEVADLFRVLRTLKSNGATVILIAHKLAEIMAVADRVTVLRKGNNVAESEVSKTDIQQLARWMVYGGESNSDKMSYAPARKVIRRTPSSPILHGTGLTALGDRGEVAVNCVDLSISKGEIFGIGGVDGNGQVELAECLAGIREFTAGSLLWNGAKFLVGKNPLTGYIPQDRRRDGLAVNLSIVDNLLFDAVRDKNFQNGPFLSKKKLNNLANSLVQEFDIRTSNPGLPASSLSGGNQQKIVVARALYKNPDLIVAMNPTRGLDIHATEYVHSRLLEARTRGASIVLFSTDIDEIKLLADRAAIISHGTLSNFDLEKGSGEELGMLLGGVGLESGKDR